MMVLDASAVLAFLQGERGSEVVRAALEGGGAILSAVTWAEIAFKASRLGLNADPILAIVDVDPFNVTQATLSAQFALPGLSLGDRSCLALAQELDLPALTADRLWTEVADVEVRQIRE